MPENAGLGRQPGFLSRLPLVTNRLNIRAFRMNDHAQVFDLHRNHAVTRFAGASKTRQQSLASLDRMISRVDRTGFGPLAVLERSRGTHNPRVVGWCGIQPLPGSDHYEVIYAFSEDVWGKGYATEAARALIHTAFSITSFPRDEVVGLVYPQNIQSIRVLEKLGMTFKEYSYVELSRRYACLYSCSRRNFFRRYAQTLAS